jgi:hypothetical protein
MKFFYHAPQRAIPHYENLHADRETCRYVYPAYSVNPFKFDLAQLVAANSVIVRLSKSGPAPRIAFIKITRR